MMVSLDGYFEGLNHDLSWHCVDREFNIFAAEQLREIDLILFGRKTYQLMESFWPSKAGLEDDPIVANLMNNTPKVVVSSSLNYVHETEHWKNIMLIKDNIVEKLRKLKEQPGKDIALLASNKLLVYLVEQGLVDELRVMINPVAIGKGTQFFTGIQSKQKFSLDKTRIFGNGNVLLYYSVLAS